MLINITGSSQMSLHEVNDACEVIREAAEYDDVQINFGGTIGGHGHFSNTTETRISSRIDDGGFAFIADGRPDASPTPRRPE